MRTKISTSSLENGYGGKRYNPRVFTEQGEILLTCKCINQGNNCNLIISVRDTGRGIKAENTNGLFSKFNRLDLERNTTTEGTGLGLAITKALVEMMGGKINVQSQFGVESIFIVQIPQQISKLVKPMTEQEILDTASRLKIKAEVNMVTTEVPIEKPNTEAQQGFNQSVKLESTTNLVYKKILMKMIMN